MRQLPGSESRQKHTVDWERRCLSYVVSPPGVLPISGKIRFSTVPTTFLTWGGQQETLPSSPGCIFFRRAILSLGFSLQESRWLPFRGAVRVCVRRFPCGLWSPFLKSQLCFHFLWVFCSGLRKIKLKRKRWKGRGKARRGMFGHDYCCEIVKCQ